VTSSFSKSLADGNLGPRKIKNLKFNLIYILNIPADISLACSGVGARPR
jgi:hypothetical protein